jgi:hypothetical protein
MFLSSMSDIDSDSTRYWKISPMAVAAGASIGRIPSGSASIASCIRCWTCARAKYKSTLSSNVTVTTEMPAFDRDWTFVVRGSPIMAVSTG